MLSPRREEEKKEEEVIISRVPIWLVVCGVSERTHEGRRRNNSIEPFNKKHPSHLAERNGGQRQTMTVHLFILRGILGLLVRRRFESVLKSRNFGLANFDISRLRRVVSKVAGEISKDV